MLIGMFSNLAVFKLLVRNLLLALDDLRTVGADAASNISIKSQEIIAHNEISTLSASASAPAPAPAPLPLALLLPIIRLNGMSNEMGFRTASRPLRLSLPNYESNARIVDASEFTDLGKG